MRREEASGGIWTGLGMGDESGGRGRDFGKTGLVFKAWVPGSGGLKTSSLCKDVGVSSDCT